MNKTSPEMKKTYYLNKAMWVDLYYNDQFGLEQVYSYLQFNAQNSIERNILLVMEQINEKKA